MLIAQLQAARTAFEDGSPWRKMSASDRGRLLWKLADLLEQNIDEIAELETLDNGKPIFESRYVDMPMVIDVFRYYAGIATKIHGETVNTFDAAFTYTLREPVGVVGAIVAWNFPLLLTSWKLGPALACGCTVVLKPAEQTPLIGTSHGTACDGSRIPAGRAEHRDRRSGNGPSAGAASGDRQDGLHRIDLGRQGDHAWFGRHAEARDVGTGRQVSQHRLCR